MKYLQKNLSNAYELLLIIKIESFKYYNAYNVYMINNISVRINDEMKTEIEIFTKEEKLEQTSEAARKLLAIGLEEWRKEKALKLLEDGKISISKAAEMTKTSVWDVMLLIKERGIIWIKDKYILEDIKKRL